MAHGKRNQVERQVPCACEAFAETLRTIITALDEIEGVDAPRDCYLRLLEAVGAEVVTRSGAALSLDH